MRLDLFRSDNFQGIILKLAGNIFNLILFEYAKNEKHFLFKISRCSPLISFLIYELISYFTHTHTHKIGYFIDVILLYIDFIVILL